MWYVSCLCESVSRPRELGDDCWHLMVFIGCPTFCVWPRGYLRYSYMATKAQHKCIANLYLFHTTPWGHADSGWMLDHSILGVYFPCYKFKLRLWPAAQLIFFLSRYKTPGYLTCPFTFPVWVTVDSRGTEIIHEKLSSGKTEVTEMLRESLLVSLTDWHSF